MRSHPLTSLVAAPLIAATILAGVAHAQMSSSPGARPASGPVTTRPDRRLGDPGQEQGGASVMDHGMPADVRVALNGLFAEHIWLAGAATGAALQGSETGFAAAAAALDSNSAALADAVGQFHGAAAREAFLPLWRRHIGFVVDYTRALSMKDSAGQEKSVRDLLGYANDLAAFLHSAHPALPTATLAELIRGHIVTLKTVIDAQGSGDWARAFLVLRKAAAHMQAIADPLAADLARKTMSK